MQEAYLYAAGIHNPGGLLPAPTSTGPATYTINTDDASECGEGDDVVSRLVNAIASCVERAGSALAFLGGWLRDRFQEAVGGTKEEQQGLEGEQGAAGNAAGGARGKNAVLGSVMVVAVAVFCMMIARRPLVFRSAATAAVVAGMAGQQRR